MISFLSIYYPRTFGEKSKEEREKKGKKKEEEERKDFSGAEASSSHSGAERVIFNPRSTFRGKQSWVP